MSEIVSRDNPVLNQVAEPITEFSEETVRLFSKMFKTLIDMPYGERLGMAFPQIGISLRGIIVLGTAMANPEWHPVKQQSVDTIEGCYSLPAGDTYKRTRAAYGWIKWQNPQTGEWVEEKITGLKAIVFQHELDHINGLLCNR